MVGANISGAQTHAAAPAVCTENHVRGGADDAALTKDQRCGARHTRRQQPPTCEQHQQGVQRNLCRLCRLFVARQLAHGGLLLASSAQQAQQGLHAVRLPARQQKQQSKLSTIALHKAIDGSVQREGAPSLLFSCPQPPQRYPPSPPIDCLTQCRWPGGGSCLRRFKHQTIPPSASQPQPHLALPLPSHPMPLARRRLMPPINSSAHAASAASGQSPASVAPRSAVTTAAGAPSSSICRRQGPDRKRWRHAATGSEQNWHPGCTLLERAKPASSTTQVVSGET